MGPRSIPKTLSAGRPRVLYNTRLCVSAHTLIFLPTVNWICLHCSLLVLLKLFLHEKLKSYQRRSRYAITKWIVNPSDFDSNRMDSNYMCICWVVIMHVETHRRTYEGRENTGVHWWSMGHAGPWEYTKFGMDLPLFYFTWKMNFVTMSLTIEWCKESSRAQHIRFIYWHLLYLGLGLGRRRHVRPCLYAPGVYIFEAAFFWLCLCIHNTHPHSNRSVWHTAD